QARVGQQVAAQDGVEVVIASTQRRIDQPRTDQIARQVVGDVIVAGPGLQYDARDRHVRTERRGGRADRDVVRVVAAIVVDGDVLVLDEIGRRAALDEQGGADDDEVNGQ